MRTPWFQCDAS